jgi:hypothetical protein
MPTKFCELDAITPRPDRPVYDRFPPWLIEASQSAPVRVDLVIVAAFVSSERALDHGPDDVAALEAFLGDRQRRAMNRKPSGGAGIANGQRSASAPGQQQPAGTERRAKEDAPADLRHCDAPPT